MRTPSVFTEPTSAPEEQINAHTDAPKQDLAAPYERCAFCQTKLLFSHEVNLGSFEVIEATRCPSCGVAKAPKRFTLQ